MLHSKPDTQVSGGHRAEVTPVPIPNTAVKLCIANDTARATAWESRTPPGYILKGPRAFEGPFAFQHPYNERMTVAVRQETHGAEDASLLDESWRSRTTFVYLPEKTSVTSDWLERSVALLPADLQQDHFALLTSGSTGEPKLVIGSRARAETLTRILHEAQHSEPVEETILALPLSYSYAFINQWLWSRTFARPLVTTDGFRKPDRLLASLRAARNAMLCLVGSQLPLFDALAGDAVFDGIIRLHFAGGRFPQEQLPRPAIPLSQRAHLQQLRLRRGSAAIDGATRGGERLCTSMWADPSQAFPCNRTPTAHFAFAVRMAPWRSSSRVVSKDRSGRLGGDGRSRPRGRRWPVDPRRAFRRRVQTAWREGFRRGDRHRRQPPSRGIAATYREADRLGEAGLVLVLSPTPDVAELNGILRALRESFSRPHWPLRIEALETMPLLPNGKPDTAAASRAERAVLWRQRI